MGWEQLLGIVSMGVVVVWRSAILSNNVANLKQAHALSMILIEKLEIALEQQNRRILRLTGDIKALRDR